MTGPNALALYSLVIIAASVAGGLVPILVRLTHRRLQLATSAIAGFMLGVALLHLLPHALMGVDPLTAAAATPTCRRRGCRGPASRPGWCYTR